MLSNWIGDDRGLGTAHTFAGTENSETREGLPSNSHHDLGYIFPTTQVLLGRRNYLVS